MLNLREKIMLKTKVYYDSFRVKCVICSQLVAQNRLAKIKTIQTGFPNTAIGWTTVNPAPNTHHWLNQCFYAA